MKEISTPIWLMGFRGGPVSTSDGTLLKLVELALHEANHESRFAHARLTQQHKFVVPNSVHFFPLLIVVYILEKGLVSSSYIGKKEAFYLIAALLLLLQIDALVCR
jgi:hypothetical protein